MATGYITARHESIPGNETNVPTYSTKRIYWPALSFNPNYNVSHLMRDDEMRNVDQPLMALSERKAPEWSMETRNYPDSLGFLLTLILGLPTTTAGNGVITDPDSATIPAPAYRHVWTAPFGPSGVSPLTAYFQAAYKDQSVFFDVKGAGCQSLSIETPEEGGSRLSASGPGLFMARVADPSLTPAYESLAIPPFMQSNLTLPTWLSGGGATTDFSVNIENPMEVDFTLGIASEFPDIVYKSDGPIAFTGSAPTAILDVDDINALTAATGFPVKAKWISTSIIGSGYPYKLFIEFDNAQFVGGGPEALENRRRIGGTFDFKATFDGAGASATVTLVNVTTSYA
jgi:hypothetical protein